MNAPLPNILKIDNLHSGVTYELLYKEFKKCGTIQAIKIKKDQGEKASDKVYAYITFSSQAEAQKAKLELNHSKLLQREINIVPKVDASTYKEMKKFNLLFTKLPKNTDTKTLGIYLESEFGDVFSLDVKKNDKGENLGYGFVQFTKEEAVKKALDAQAQNGGSLKITNSEDTFTLVNLEEDTKYSKGPSKYNYFRIDSIFPGEVTEQQEPEAQEFSKKISDFLAELFDDKQQIIFKIILRYDLERKNYKMQVRYNAEMDSDEYITKIEKFLKDLLHLDSKSIQFFDNSLIERNLFLNGIRENITEQQFREWLQKHVKLSNDDIRSISFGKGKDSQHVKVSLASKLLGESLIVYCGGRKNEAQKNEVFTSYHKVTLLMGKKEREQVKSFKKKLTEDKASFTSSQTKKPQLNYGDSNNSIGRQMPMDFSMFPQFLMPNQMQMGKVPQIPQTYPYPNVALPPTYIPQHRPRVAPQPQQQRNPKLTPEAQLQLFSRQGNEELKVKTAREISRNFSNFEQAIQKEQDNHTLLGQIIYYRIKGLDSKAEPELKNHLKAESDAVAEAKINEFKAEVSKITGMLIDREVFEISDMFDFIKLPQELIERCVEALSLIQQESQ